MQRGVKLVRKTGKIKKGHVDRKKEKGKGGHIPFTCPLSLRSGILTQDLPWGFLREPCSRGATCQHELEPRAQILKLSFC